MTGKLGLRPRIGAAILLALLLAAVFAPLVSPLDPYEFGIPYLEPSAAHLLGTNDVGQDILSELVYGARVSLIIGVTAAFAVTAAGAAVGLTSGYWGGKADVALMGLTNVFMSLPALPLTVVLVAYLGPGLRNVILAICLTAWTGTARVVRSRVLQLKELPFVKIEKTLGAGPLYVMFRHLLPNIGELVFVRGVLAVASAMLAEAGLSFLGLGTAGAKSWGSILHYAFFRGGLVNGCYWWYLPPMICISLSVTGFLLLSYVGERRGPAAPAAGAAKGRRADA
ncbi:MAG: ABC transporter permease [Deltaproteobacteria bacterium]|nr:ABC transporter permease [Deltaproteobacteria bacterium]